MTTLRLPGVMSGTQFVLPGRRPPRSSQSAFGTASVHINANVGGTTVAPAPFPTYTDYPLVEWTTLDPSYASRNLNNWAELPEMSTILNKLTFRAYVHLPEGFRGKITDFKSQGTPYGCYAPNCMGLWGHGPEKAVIRMAPMSSTVAALVPLQGAGNANGDGTSNPYTMMRLGPMNSSVSAAVHNYGFAMFGTHQPDQLANPDKAGTTQHPHNYSGYQDYMGSGSTTVWCVFGGVQGDWQSPPGETFVAAMLRSKTQCFMDYCEFTGFTEGDVAHGANPTDYLGTSFLESERVSGGVGCNAAVNPTFRWCNFHDFFVSGGPIVSGAGGPAGALCIGGTMVQNKSWYNANHFPTSTPGKQFGGLNNEGCIGPQQLLYDQPDIRLGPYQNTLQNYHVFLGNWLQDHPDIVINKPIIQGIGSPAGTFITSNNGALYVGMPVTYSGQPNKQVTPPTVIGVNGNVLIARERAAGAGMPSNVNPATEYVLAR